MTSDDERIERAVATLARGLRGLAWDDPQQLRRAARRRRVRRQYGLVTMSVATALAVAAAIVVSQPAARAPQVRIVVVARLGSATELAANVSHLSGTAGSAAGSAVAGAEQGFAVRLLHQVSGTHVGSVAVSPISLAVGLTMLENGAKGATRNQITATLGTSALSLVRQDQGWASLLAALTWAGKDDRVAVQSANSLWLQKGLPMEPPFMARMARYFSAGVWQADFAHHLPGAQEAINRWASQHTNGKITRLFGPGDIDQATLAVLANAVHFLAAWKTPFNPNLSYPGTFHASQGRAARVIFMTQRIKHAAITRGYQVVQLPYAGGRFSAVAIMPRGQTLQEFVSSLTPPQLSQIIAAAHQPADVQLNLPRFTTQNYLNLDQALAAMGMPAAFTFAADFSAMSPVALQVQSAVQRDYVSVGEKGTQAAAATGISMVPISAGPTITFDRPFLFIIRDSITGVILFAGLVQNPAS